MHPDSHLWYRNRCTQIKTAVKLESEIEESKEDESSSRDEPELTTRVLRARNNDEKTESQVTKLPTVVPPIKIQLQTMVSELQRDNTDANKHLSVNVKDKCFEDSEEVSGQSLSPTKFPKSYDKLNIVQSCVTDD